MRKIFNLHSNTRQTRDSKMSETKPNETKPKRMVNRSVAITLGIVCIVLVIVSLVGAFAYYTPIINEKDNTISSLNSQVASLNTRISDQSNTISSLNSQISSLNSQISSLNTQATNEQSQLANLQSQLNSLQLQYTNLQSQNTNLQANYSQLMNEYQQALAKIPSDKGITIDGINYSAGNTGSVTGVAVRNLGVNAVTVVSLKLYWNTEGVLSSSVSVNVVIPANSTTSIQTFLPINGWNSVYDTWTVKVETLEGYNATSDPIMIIL